MIVQCEQSKATVARLKPEQDSKPAREWFALAVLLLAAVCLWSYHLGAESLWQDELYSIFEAKHSSVWTLLTTENRPLYFLILKLWMHFGTSETWLRAVNLPIAFGAVMAVYLLGRRVMNHWVGLCAAAFLTLSPMFISHTQEVRMYALSVFTGVSGSLAFLYALQKPSKSAIAAWAVFRFLSSITTPLNALLLGTDLLVVISRSRADSQRMREFAMYWVLTLLACSPWLTILICCDTTTFMNGWISGLQKPDLLQLGKLPIQFLFGTTEHLKVVCIIVLTGCLVAATARWRSNMSVRVLTAWICVPLSILFSISILWNTLWIDRYLLMTAPYLFVVLAVGLAGIWSKSRPGAVAIALAYLTVVTLNLQDYFGTPQRQDWRAVFQTIKSQEQPGDAIAICDFEDPESFFEYYYAGKLPIVRFDRGDPQSIPFPDFRRADRNLRNRKRLWIICRGIRSGGPQSRGELHHAAFCKSYAGITLLCIAGLDDEQ
jgi:uncharacterized membrane protein